MASPSNKCILDLNSVGDFGRLGRRYIEAETRVLDSISAINEFLIQAFSSAYGSTNFHPFIFEYGVIVDPELYPNSTDNTAVVSARSWLNSLLDPINKNELAKSNPVSKGIYFVESVTPAGVIPYSDGKINLEPVGGDKCKKGYYGIVGDKIEARNRIYEVCFVPRTYENLSKGEQTVYFKATRVDDKIVEYFDNLAGPTIISNDISLRSGKGISIEDDLEMCPPVINGIFNATDYDFGLVNIGKKYIGNIDITNEGNTDLLVTDLNPKTNPNFTIGEFTTGGSALLPTPLSLPFMLSQGETKKFSVEYDPRGETEVSHEYIINYSVETISNRKTPVVQRKMTSRLSGSAFTINIVCSDADWGSVNVKNTSNTKQITINNSGTRDAYLIDYKFVGRNPEKFSSGSLPTVSVTSPFLIERNSQKTFDVLYNPAEEIDVKHTATINFTFAYDDPINGVLAGRVDGTKLFSSLIAEAFKDPFDDVVDDYGDGGVFDPDDNGVYVTKVISRIIDKSAPIIKYNTFGLWKCEGERLITFFTGSNGAKKDSFFIPVYNREPNTPDSFHQFDISYGHRLGSGSSYVENLVDLFPSKAMYKKYLIECYERNGLTPTSRTTSFKFKNDVNSDSVYFIQLDRDNFRDMLDPGNFELSLSPLTSSLNQLINTGSNVAINQSSSLIYTLIDESWDTKQNATDEHNLKDWYYVVSGSKRDGVYGEPSDNAWGVVFPKLGLIVLDGHALDLSCSFNTVTASINGHNAEKLFLSISGSSSTLLSRNYSGSFFARSSEKVIRETYFCRLRQEEFNYSTNPTYTSGSLNDLRYTYFVKTPQSYITTIGLYNKRRELLAVGKLRRPLLKNDSKSYVFEVRVRLN